MNIWSEAKRILAVRLDAMGAVLMTGPALRALEESLPGRQVTLLTSPAGSVGASLLPGLARVIVYDAPWVKATAPRSSAQPDLDLIEMLRRERFDAAVIFTVSTESPLPAALACYLADIPLRLAHCRENPYQLLTDWVREFEPEGGVRHEVRRQLDLVAAVGCHTPDDRMCVNLSEEVIGHVRQKLWRLKLENGWWRWAVVHPGTTTLSRRYPPELFAQACRELALRHGVRLVFTGTPGERALVDEIRALMEAPSESLVGELNPEEMAALLATAQLLIANSAGPVHLASAVGCPVVDLYALTNPQNTPWRVPHRIVSHDVPCRWCYQSVSPQGQNLCLRGVDPRDIVHAALDLLTPVRYAVAANVSGSDPHRNGWHPPD